MMIKFLFKKFIEAGIHEVRRHQLTGTCLGKSVLTSSRSQFVGLPFPGAKVFPEVLLHTFVFRSSDLLPAFFLALSLLNAAFPTSVQDHIPSPFSTTWSSPYLFLRVSTLPFHHTFNPLPPSSPSALFLRTPEQFRPWWTEPALSCSAGAGELQQGEDGPAVCGEDHGQPHRDGP